MQDVRLRTGRPLLVLEVVKPSPSSTSEDVGALAAKVTTEAVSRWHKTSSSVTSQNHPLSASIDDAWQHSKLVARAEPAHSGEIKTKGLLIALRISAKPSTGCQKPA